MTFKVYSLYDLYSYIKTVMLYTHFLSSGNCQVEKDYF